MKKLILTVAFAFVATVIFAQVENAKNNMSKDAKKSEATMKAADSDAKKAAGTMNAAGNDAKPMETMQGGAEKSVENKAPAHPVQSAQPVQPVQPAPAMKPAKKASGTTKEAPQN